MAPVAMAKLTISLSSWLPLGYGTFFGEWWGVGKELKLAGSLPCSLQQVKEVGRPEARCGYPTQLLLVLIPKVHASITML